MEKSKILAVAILALLVALAAAIAFRYSPQLPQQNSPVPVAATVPVSAVPEPAPIPVAPAAIARKYNITIDTSADWSRIALANAAFTTADAAAGLNPIEIITDPPETIGHFVYAPNEVLIHQKVMATTHIVLRCVIESAQTTIKVNLSHGDNGPLTISSPVDSATNDKVLGDGRNAIEVTLRLQ